VRIIKDASNANALSKNFGFPNGIAIKPTITIEIRIPSIIFFESISIISKTII
jgi:hypothetical protein